MSSAPLMPECLTQVTEDAGVRFLLPDTAEDQHVQVSLNLFSNFLLL